MTTGFVVRLWLKFRRSPILSLSNTGAMTIWDFFKKKDGKLWMLMEMEIAGITHSSSVLKVTAFSHTNQLKKAKPRQYEEIGLGKQQSSNYVRTFESARTSF